MRASTPIEPGAGTSGPFLRTLLAAVALLHVALFLLVPDTDAKFMLGDRSNDRFVKITTLLEAPSLDAAAGVIYKQASPGDYLLFVPAYAAAGPSGVMLQNLVLFLAGVAFLYWLTQKLFGETSARIAAIAYALLPSSLFHPHAFVSEAICDPVLIIATYFLARWLVDQEQRTADLLTAAALLSIAVFVRHIYLFLPLVIAALLWAAVPAARRPSVGALGAFLAVSFSVLVGWQSVDSLVGHRYPRGESVGGLQSNLFLRAERMAGFGAFELPAEVRDRIAHAGGGVRTVTPGEFAAIAAAHPGAYLRSVVSDAGNLIGNPGIAMVAGRYLGLFDLGERHYSDMSKWRETREREGVLGLLAEIWRTSPAGLVLMAVGGLLWAGFLAVALAGLVGMWQSPAVPLAAKALLTLLPAYLLGLTSLTAGYTRWDHRSPAEFVLAILFGLGVVMLRAWVEQRRAGSLTKAA